MQIRYEGYLSDYWGLKHKSGLIESNVDHFDQKMISEDTPGSVDYDYVIIFSFIVCFKFFQKLCN